MMQRMVSVLMEGCFESSWSLIERRWSQAAALRANASALAKATMQQMYTAEGGRGWFNVIWPPDASGGPAPEELKVFEMRHVVDFFSVTFGLCGLTQVCSMHRRTGLCVQS